MELGGCRFSIRRLARAFSVPLCLLTSCTGPNPPPPVPPPFQQGSCTGGLELAATMSPGNYHNTLTGLSVLSPTEAWAVGSSTNVPPAWLSPRPPGMISPAPPELTVPLALRWNGRTWDRVQAPNAGVVDLANSQPVGGAGFTDVAVRSADDVWAVGGGQSPLIEHWDGTTWAVVLSPPVNLVDERLAAVAADAPDDAWAAGSGGESGAIGPVIEHWDGRAWTITPVADIDARYTTVADLLALSPTDAWAVGQMWDHALVLHWDGDQWAQVASPRDRATRLSALAAVASDDLWAVGTTFADVDGNGPTQGVIEHWDGRAWNLVTLPALTPGTALASVSALGRDDVWVAGNTTRSDGSAYSRLLLHYDGSQWTMVRAPKSGPVPSRIAASSDGRVWAIGTRYIDGGFSAFIARLCA